MRRTSRRTVSVVVSVALATALGVAAIAWADGASENVSTIEGNFKPHKLPKRDYKKGSVFVELTHDYGTTSLGSQQNPEQDYIDFDDDIKFKQGTVTPCAEGDLTGTTTAAAKAACPDSQVGDGDAHARIPGYPATDNEATDFVVTAFDGPGNDIYLHFISPSVDAGFGGTGATAVVVHGDVVNSPLGGDFGKRLSVTDAPDVAGDAGGVTLFNATIKRGKYVNARCHDGNHKLNYKLKIVYDDLSVDTAKDSSSCSVA